MGWRFPLLSVWAVLVLLNFLVASPFPGGHESRPAAFRRALVATRTEPAPSDPGRRGAVAANVVRQLATTGLALTIVAALSGWGSAVVSWLRAGSLGVPGMAWAAGLLAGGLTVLGLGFAGLVVPRLLWVGGLAGIALLFHRRLRVAPVTPPAPGEPAPGWIRWGERCAAGWWWLAALSPEPGIDAYVYHLRLPFYYQLHHKVYSVWHHIHGHVPQVWELQLTAVAPDWAAGVAQMLSALTVLPAWRLMVALGGGTAMARAAALLLMSSPLVVGIGASAYTDLPLLWLGLASYAALTSKGGATPARVAAGVLLGAACSLKYAAFPVVASHGAWLAAESFRRRRWTWGLPVAAAALAVFLPWLAWNGFASGNPFDPFLGRWFPHALPALPFAERLSASVFRRSLREIAAAVWNGYVACEPFLFLSPWILMAAPAALWWRGRGETPGAGTWLAAYLATWSWMIADERFGLVAAAVLAAGLARHATVRPPRGVWLALLALNVAGSASQQFLPWPRLRAAAAVDARAAYERATLPPAPAFADAAGWLNGHAAPADRILFVSECRTHLVWRECIADHVIDYPTRLSYLLNRTAPDPGRVSARFRQLGIRWVLYLPGRCAARLAEMPDLFDFTPATARAWERFWLARASRAWSVPDAAIYRLGPAAGSRRGAPDLPGVQDVMFFSIGQTFRREGPEPALAELRRYAAGYPGVGAVRRRLADALDAMRRDPSSRAEAARCRAFAAGLEGPDRP